MPITSTHKQYADQCERWARNRAACAGQDAVKLASTDFLPDDNATDRSNEARSRYLRYLLRAVWMPVSGYTKQGLIGMMSRRPAEVELPSQIEYAKGNADGATSCR